MSSTIQLRVDDELKKKSDSLFNELGTDTNSAIKIFLAQSIANNGFPFEIKVKEGHPFTPLSEGDLLKKLEIARKHSKQGKYKEADSVIAELRSKYGL